MIPAFERNGLLPEGEHECEWPEFVLRFGGTADNGRRKRLLLGLARMLVLLGEAGCRVVLVDGSFVTRERWPQDFDACYEEEGMNSNLLPAVLKNLTLGRAAQKQEFGGEVLPADFPFDRSGRPVREAFAQTRDKQPKGLIRLEPWLIHSQVADWLDDGKGETDGTTT